MEFDLSPQSDDEAYWVEFDSDQEPDPEKRVSLLIAPKTPLIEEDCMEKATPRMANINGRFRGGRNIPIPRLNFGYYQRLVFQACVKDWRNINDKATGAPIPCDDEHKAWMSKHHKGLLQFGYEIADALGEMTIEQIEEERKSFRRANQVSTGPSEPELSDL